MSEATPRPWAQGSVLPDVVVDESGNTILFPPTAIRTNAEKKANSALVVAAVNSYDAHRELLEAAKALLRTLEGQSLPAGELVALEDAIAKVEAS